MASPTAERPAVADLPTDPEELARALVARARALRPQLIADEADAERRTYYSAELDRAFEEAGFYRMYLPRRFGGLEVDVPTFVKTIIEVGRGSLAAAWCLCLTANHSLQVASWFGERAQHELLGGGTFRAASVAAPTVRATRVQGGYRLDGEVAYCSGIPYATHFMGQAMLAPAGGGEPEMALFVAPRSEYEQLGVWGRLAGLKGTGSDTIRFDGGFVPEHHVLERTSMVDFPADGGTAGLALHGNPLYAGRALTIFTLSLAAPVVGGAYGALDEYAEAMRTRMTALPPFRPRVEDADFQRHYGSALARIGVAEAAVVRGAELHMENCRNGAAGTSPVTAADDFRVAAIVREACLHAWEAIEQDLLRTIGSSALTEGTRFERAVRDFGQVAGHRNFALRDAMFRLTAAQHLGVEPVE